MNQTKIPDEGAVKSGRAVFKDDALRFIGKFVKFSGRRGIYTLALVGSSSILEGFGLLAVVPLLAIAGNGHSGVGGNWIFEATDRFFSSIHIHSTEGKLGVLLGLFALIGILRAILLSFRQLAVMGLQLEFMARELTDVIGLLANAPWQKISRLQHARVNYLLSSDIGNIASAGSIVIECTMSLVLLAIQTAVALLLSPMMTLFCLLILAIGTVAMYPIVKGSHKLGEATADIRLDLLHNTGQFLGALKLVVGQNLQAKFVNMFQSLFGMLIRQNMDFARAQKRNRVGLTIAGMAVAGVAAVTGIAVFHIAPAILITLLLIFTRMSQPVTQIQSQVMSFIGCMPACRKVEELRRDFARPAGEPLRPESTALAFEREIEFADVGYVHDGNTEDGAAASGVRNLNFVVKKGDFIGIAGTSGAGKTTLADLLVGLYQPQDGAIRVDGDVLDQTNEGSWREVLAYVSQDSVMFNETLRENLLWANEKASEAEIAEALAIAGADAVVERLPRGLATVTGERGMLISGGERQRFAIARALLRKPKLLVLDEATNAIDLKGERALLERLNTLRPELTILLIAHRVETLSLCNRVIIMKKGRIVSEDSFENLREQLAMVHEHAGVPHDG
jgi:ATP-binding cassette, subfamily C, bacterial